MNLEHLTEKNAEVLAQNGIDPAEIKQLLIQVKQRDAEERKKFEIKPTKTLVSRLALASNMANSETLEFKHRNDLEYWLAKFITCDTDMLKLKDHVRRLASEPDSILILGETGTGKELLARALHGNRKGLFMAVNCGGFPEHLIESELFGHEAGAFTGAIRDKLGLFQAATDGTLFLDEIAELPVMMQVKLFRALQERIVRKVGSITDFRVNCRIIAASNRNIPELVEQGLFREELYWRLSTIELHTKPLRLRAPDISMITDKLGRKLEAAEIFSLSTHLNGNVRELQRIVRRKQLNIN